MNRSIVPVLVVIIVILVAVLLATARAGNGAAALATPIALPAPALPVVEAPSPTPARPARPASAVGRTNPAHAAYLPDPKKTPGDSLDVTVDDICQAGYSSKVRDVPTSVKNQVYAEYGITTHKSGEYEVDHLISLELGGSNSVRNLWPESYSGPWNAHEKDKLEDHLHAEVCNGRLDLKSAQREISVDWITAYVKYFGEPKP